ncbi:MAG: patatin-like phospholipase family protein [Bacteroidales bacterium]|nr:patatin-like phospholipase family protein [Bacteroidales bacterium]
MKKILTLLMLLLPLASFAQEDEYSSFGLDARDQRAVREIRQRMARIRQTRPTVGLVLSGGGAKGAATVGVLKYLEEYDIPIDLVVGTSIGGLLGSLYSLGYDAAYLDSLVRHINWDMALSDKLDQKYIPYSRRRYNEKYMLSFPFYYRDEDYKNFLAGDAPFARGRSRQLELGVKGRKGRRNFSELVRGNLLGSLPSGFVFGQNVNQIITSRTVGYSDSTDFFHFPIPFACVATDVASGKAKVWRNGSVNLAMRSTMSIPGLFAPVRTGGMVLVDGGMRNNFPVNIAKEMGADIIIGVNLAQSSLTANEIQNLADVLTSSMDLLSNDVYERNVEQVDIHIHPDLGSYNMLSFSSEAVDTMLVMGYNAAVQKAPQLQALRKRLGASKFKLHGRKAVDIGRQDVFIREVVVDGVSSKEADYVREHMTCQAGMMVSKQMIEDDVATIFGKGSYDYVNYELRGKAEPYTLRIYCKRGPMHQLGFSARMDTEDIVSLLVNVGLNTRAMSGHSLDLSARISANPYIDAVYSYSAHRFGTINVRSMFRYTDRMNMYYNAGRFNTSFMLATQEVYLSNIHWSTLDVNLGLRNQYFQLRSLLTDVDVRYNVTQKVDVPSLFLTARLETLDNGYFPSKGVSVGFRTDGMYRLFESGLPARWMAVASADGRFPVSFGSFTLIPSFAARFVFGPQTPLMYSNVIGGDIGGNYIEQQLPFVGVTSAALCRDHLGMVRLDARYEVASNHFVSLMNNVAYEFDGFDASALQSGRWLYGVGLGYGYNTIVGPLKAQLSWSNVTKKVGIYLSFGYSF